MLIRKVARGLIASTRRLSTKISTSENDVAVTIRTPPPTLRSGCRERPTPIVFLPWECRGSSSWEPHLKYFSDRGITAASFEWREDGLDAMEARLVNVIGALGSTPPVIVGRSLGGFIAQQYLESHPAAGAVLVDPFPPAPMELVRWLSEKALNCRPQDVLTIIESNPNRAEELLRDYFSARLGHQWRDAKDAREPDIDKDDINLGISSAELFPFPVRALTELLRGNRVIKLEPRSTNMLVVSSGLNQLFPSKVALSTSEYHNAPITFVRHGIGLASVIYDWYDEAY